MSAGSPLNVVIAGAGVAGLEALLALRELAGDRVCITVVSDRDDFLYRPPSVNEPFGGRGARRLPIAPIAGDADAALHSGRAAAVDAGRRELVLDGGDRLAYDALILAPGASAHPAFKHVTTFDPARADEQLHGLIQDLEEGYSHSVAFIAPDPPPWPLPLYELTLMTAERCYSMDVAPEITIVTSERAPLGVFGPVVSTAIEQRLADLGVSVYTSVAAQVHDGRRITLPPPHKDIVAERIVSLPRLAGPGIHGLALDGHGFIKIDRRCAVPGAPGVFAAGDATDFPVRQGSVAAQQAEVAARGVAALAGLPVDVAPLQATVYGALATGRKPLYIRARVVGGAGTSSEVFDTCPWDPPTKVVATRLGPYLERLERYDAAAPAGHR